MLQGSGNRSPIWGVAIAVGLIVAQHTAAQQESSKSVLDEGGFRPANQPVSFPQLPNLPQLPEIKLESFEGSSSFVKKNTFEQDSSQGQAIGSGVAKLVIHNDEDQDQAVVSTTTEVASLPEKFESDFASNYRPLTGSPTNEPRHASGGMLQPIEGAALLPGEILSSTGEPRPFGDNLFCAPEPLAYGMVYDPSRRINPWHPDPRKAELVFNGGDQGKKAKVDSSWNLYNVTPEDTIGHFDTLDGRRLMTESNRVAIYAPRFAAVRKLDGLINSESRMKVGSMDEKKALQLSEAKDFSTTTKQHLSVDRFHGAKRASGLRENNRGVVSDNVIRLFGARNTFEAFENLALIRMGKHQNSESARLGLAMQSANVWQDNLGLQVGVAGAQPVVVNDVYKVQQIVRIDSDDKHAILRIAKVASKISAQPGETVDFTIRFDNLTGKRIGNVTIVDNLSSRLEYVPDSAECTLNADFKHEHNEVGSLVLRWEITDALPANSGGIIRFRCKVR